MEKGFLSICNCGPEETQGQIEYLSSTPVSRIAELLSCGECILRKGIIDSLQHVGNLKTEFGQIGSLVAEELTGRKKFIVSEVVPILKANPKADPSLLRSIECIMVSEAKGEVEFNITVLLEKGEATIKDGNKRTIAFFENRRHLSYVSTAYEIYLVVPK